MEGFQRQRNDLDLVSSRPPLDVVRGKRGLNTVKEVVRVSVLVSLLVRVVGAGTQTSLSSACFGHAEVHASSTRFPLDIKHFSPALKISKFTHGAALKKY